MAQYEKFTDLVRDIAEWHQTFPEDKAAILEAVELMHAGIERAETAATTATEAAAGIPEASVYVRGMTQLADAEALAAGDSTRAVTAGQLKATNDIITQIVTQSAPNATENEKGIAMVASPEEASAGADNSKIMTSARVADYIDARLADITDAADITNNSKLQTPRSTAKTVESLTAVKVISDNISYSSVKELPDGKYLVKASSAVSDLPVAGVGAWITVERADSDNAKLVALTASSAIKECRMMQLDGVWYEWRNFDMPYVIDTSKTYSIDEINADGRFEITMN